MLREQATTVVESQGIHLSLEACCHLDGDGALLLCQCYAEVKHHIQPVWEVSIFGSQPNRVFSSIWPVIVM